MGGTKPVKTELSRDASIPLHNEPGTSYIPHISQRYNRHQGTGLWELELYGAVLQCHHCDTRQGVYIIFCSHKFLCALQYHWDALVPHAL